MEDTIKRSALNFQKNELTEYYIYKKFSEKLRKNENSRILLKIANEEFSHYEKLRKFTGEILYPSKFKIFIFDLFSKIFGLTFALKLMEKVEENSQKNYEKFKDTFPESLEILKEEKEHEKLLLNMINEERIKYIGSIVLGINDAIVELMGALVGLTFALKNTKIVGIAGFITGFSASLSMAASEYISQKSENKENPLKASFYTGIAYLFTVLLMVSSYFLIKNPYLALLISILIASFIIFLFTFFVSIVKEISFRKMFLEMFFISFGIAFISFLVGLILRKFLKLEGGEI